MIITSKIISIPGLLKFLLFRQVQYSTKKFHFLFCIFFGNHQSIIIIRNTAIVYEPIAVFIQLKPATGISQPGGSLHLFT